MIIIGVILILAGLSSTVYGYMQNNNIDTQMMSIFSSGNANPGTMWIILGVVVIVIGVLLVYGGLKKKNK